MDRKSDETGTEPQAERDASKKFEKTQTQAPDAGGPSSPAAPTAPEDETHDNNRKGGYGAG